MNPEIDGLDFAIDRSNLYREESYTDLAAGTIKKMIPVKVDGTEDKSRRVVFVGQATIVTPYGSMPISNMIQAQDLQQAVKRFPEAMQTAMHQLLEEAQQVQKMQQQEQPLIHTSGSGLIVPGR